MFCFLNNCTYLFILVSLLFWVAEDQIWGFIQAGQVLGHWLPTQLLSWPQFRFSCLGFSGAGDREVHHHNWCSVILIENAETKSPFKISIFYAILGNSKDFLIIWASEIDIKFKVLLIDQSVIVEDESEALEKCLFRF